MRSRVVGMFVKKNDSLKIKLHHPLTLIPYAYILRACQKSMVVKNTGSRIRQSSLYHLKQGTLPHRILVSSSVQWDNCGAHLEVSGRRFNAIRV